MNEIIPWLPVISIAAGAVIGGVVTIVRGLMGDRSSKTPTISQIWERLDSVERTLDSERSARINLRQVFISYVNRVQSGGSSELTDDERKSLYSDKENVNGTTH